MYVLLARSELTLSTMKAVLDLRGWQTAEVQDILGFVIPTEGAPRSGNQVLFHEIVDAISDRMSGRQDWTQRPNLYFIVDSVNPVHLNPIDSIGTPESLCAMLILAFPDANWCFCSTRGEVTETGPFESNSLSQLLFGIEREPLFDSSGLRSFVRSRTNKSLGSCRHHRPCLYEPIKLRP